MKNTIYISGKMTNMPEFNYPAFFEMEDYIRKNWPYVQTRPVIIFNPARIDQEHNLDPNNRTNSREWYLTRALEMLLKCNTIIMLDGWEESAGARLEYDIARELKMVILDQRLKPYKTDILKEASIQISSAAREESYIWFGPNELGMSGFNPDYTRWHDISEQSIKDKFGYQDIIWNSRLHLSQSDVKALLPILTKFAETGELENC